MTVATFEKYKALDYEFVPFSEEMNKPRLIKTADEIASLQRAQNMADEGFKQLLTRIGISRSYISRIEKKAVLKLRLALLEEDSAAGKKDL
jgi:Xaa-Pro aminopeptidase